MCKKNDSNWLKRIAFLLVGVGTVIIVLFFCMTPFNDWSGERDATLFGLYGDFIGGFVGALFSLAGFFLLYLTLRAQQESINNQEKELKAQKKSSEQESFESTFFNLLNVQQNITNDLKAYFFRLNDLTNFESYSISGREFFRIAVWERFWINRSLSSDKYPGMYDESENEMWEHQLEQLYDPQNHDSDPFYDVDKGASEMQKERKLQLVNKVYGITKEKWEIGHDTQGKDRVNFVYDLFFHKYHYAAGHYFRNLYHIVKYVRQFEVIQRRKNADKFEDERIVKRCYQYARFIQAQMSSHELALLHDNSLGFPKMLKLVKKYNLVDNCAHEGLIFKTNYIE